MRDRENVRMLMIMDVNLARTSAGMKKALFFKKASRLFDCGVEGSQSESEELSKTKYSRMSSEAAITSLVLIEVRGNSSARQKTTSESRSTSGTGHDT